MSDTTTTTTTSTSGTTTAGPTTTVGVPQEESHLWRNILIAALVLLVIAAIVVLVFVFSSGGNTVPPASSLVGQNMSIRALPTSATNFLKSVIATQPPVLGDNSGNTTWVLQVNEKLPGYYFIKNVQQPLYLTADTPSNNNAVYMSLKNPAVDDMTLESFIIEQFGSTGYKIKSSSNTYLNAEASPIVSNATQSTATVFQLTPLLLQ